MIRDDPLTAKTGGILLVHRKPEAAFFILPDPGRIICIRKPGTGGQPAGRLQKFIDSIRGNLYTGFQISPAIVSSNKWFSNLNHFALHL